MLCHSLYAMGFSRQFSLFGGALKFVSLLHRWGVAMVCLSTERVHHGMSLLGE